MTSQQTAQANPPATSQQNISQPSESRAVSKVDAVKGGLERMRPQFQMALPSHISPERFERAALTAVNANPDLLRADLRSLFNACAKAAGDGLLPDGREGAFVTFKTKKKDDKGNDSWIKAVQWMPMVYGIIKKARQSGEISSLRARIVYQNEIDQNRFSYRIDDGMDVIKHNPILLGDRGAPVLAYAVAVLKDGLKEIEVLTQDDIAKIRAVSRASSKGPWVDWPDEMWKKSAIRRLCKRLPLSAELFETVSRDDELTDFGQMRRSAIQSIDRAAGQISAPANFDMEEDPDDAPGNNGEDDASESGDPGNDPPPLTDEPGEGGGEGDDDGPSEAYAAAENMLSGYIETARNDREVRGDLKSFDTMVQRSIDELEDLTAEERISLKRLWATAKTELTRDAAKSPAGRRR